MKLNGLEVTTRKVIDDISGRTAEVKTFINLANVTHVERYEDRCVVFFNNGKHLEVKENVFNLVMGY